MKISSAKLKQIIKEEIEALGEAGFTSLSTGPGIEVTDEDIEAAENLFAQIKDNKVNVRMKNVIADIDDDDKFYGLKKQYLNFLKNNILIAFPEYKKFSEGAKAHIMNLIENDLDDYVYDMAIYGEPMNESVGRLKQIIKEEIEGFLKEQSAVTIDFEGTTTSIEFLGMETKYDQTETKLRINGEEYSFGAYDVDDLADNVIAELGDNDEIIIIGFWEITRMRNKYHNSKESLKML